MIHVNLFPTVVFLKSMKIALKYHLNITHIFPSMKNITSKKMNTCITTFTIHRIHENEKPCRFFGFP